MSYFGCMGYENTSDLCLLTYCSPEMWIYNFKLNSSLYFLLYQIKKTNFTYRREIDKFEQFVTCPRYNWWLFFKVHFSLPMKIWRKFNKCKWNSPII